MSRISGLDCKSPNQVFWIIVLNIIMTDKVRKIDWAQHQPSHRTPRCDLGNYFKISWCELLSDKFVLDSVSFSSFCAFLRRAWCLRELSCLFKGCWRISTSQTMQTNYASSPGKVKPPLWTSLKPSHQWLSWGDWHCRYFWRRMAGNCMWEPGCTGHCWAGFGWTLFLNEQGWRLPRWETHKRHGETVPFSCIRSTQGVFQMQSSIW